jgi:hypothetical protein
MVILRIEKVAALHTKRSFCKKKSAFSPILLFRKPKEHTSVAGSVQNVANALKALEY